MPEPETTRPAQPIHTLDLGENGGKTDFYEIDDLVVWLNQEIVQWKWLDEIKKWPVTEKPSYAKLRQILKAVQSQKTQSAPLPEIVAKFDQSVRDIFCGPERLIHSRSRLGAFIHKLAESSREEAAWVLLVLRSGNNDQLTLPGERNHYPLISRELFAGVFKLLAFETGFQIEEAERAGLRTLRGEWDAILLEEKRSFEQQTAEVTRLIAAHSESIAKLQEQHEKQLDEHKSLRTSHEDRMTAIQKKFQDELAVRSGVAYWTSRAKSHRWIALGWGLLSISLFAGAVLYLPTLATELTHVPKESLQLISDEKIKDTGAVTLITQSLLSAVVRFGVIAMFFIWPLRLLVRNYVSASHLATDAAERCVIIQTYLALISDPDVSSDSELKKQILPQALQSIFRHTADGLVKDDALPSQGILDAIKGKPS